MIKEVQLHPTDEKVLENLEQIEFTNMKIKNSVVVYV